jgi:hypothetical protein
MELLLRPVASEVRTLLQRIKVENIERGLGLIPTGSDVKFEAGNLAPQLTEPFA